MTAVFDGGKGDERTIHRYIHVREVPLSQSIILLIVFFFSETAYSQMSMDFPFFDPSGKKQYSSSSIIADRMKNDQVNNDEVKIVLLQTPSLKDSIFIRQTMILDTIAVDRAKLLIVVSCPEEENKNGFFTKKTTAAGLAAEMKGYRIAVLNSSGMVIYRNNIVVPPRSLLSVLNRK